jgi:hypothetical protein
MQIEQRLTGNGSAWLDYPKVLWPRWINVCIRKSLRDGFERRRARRAASALFLATRALPFVVHGTESELRFHITFFGRRLLFAKSLRELSFFKCA